MKDCKELTLADFLISQTSLVLKDKKKVFLKAMFVIAVEEACFMNQWKHENMQKMF